MEPDGAWDAGYERGEEDARDSIMGAIFEGLTHLDDGGGHPCCGADHQHGKNTTVLDEGVTCVDCLQAMLKAARAEGLIASLPVPEWIDYPGESFSQMGKGGCCVQVTTAMGLGLCWYVTGYFAIPDGSTLKERRGPFYTSDGWTMERLKREQGEPMWRRLAAETGMTTILTGEAPSLLAP